MATEEQSSSAGWVNRFKSWLRKGEGLRYMASVHPCVINGVRHLVYKKGLAERNPHAFKCLQKYAEEHGFRLKEDQRSRYKPPRTDRRARLIPMLALSAGLLTQTVYAEPVSDGAEPIPNITVIGVQEAPERPYLKEKGKRFVAGPYGEVESILGVAAEVKSQGHVERIRARGMTMPHTSVSDMVDRYRYTFPQSCGGGSYSYYEGDRFAALGFHDGNRVILDVLVGGGPFTAPKLWGPYDQVLNENVEMHLMSGDPKMDGMAVLKASYVIGLVPDLDRQRSTEYAERYTSAVSESADCTEDLALESPEVDSQPG